MPNKDDEYKHWLETERNRNKTTPISSGNSPEMNRIIMVVFLVLIGMVMLLTRDNSVPSRETDEFNGMILPQVITEDLFVEGGESHDWLGLPPDAVDSIDPTDNFLIEYEPGIGLDSFGWVANDTLSVAKSNDILYVYISENLTLQVPQNDLEFLLFIHDVEQFDFDHYTGICVGCIAVKVKDILPLIPNGLDNRQNLSISDLPIAETESN